MKSKLFRIIHATGVLLLVTQGAIGLHAASAPAKPATPASAASPTEKSARVDVNTADQTALETLPGVGPQTAKAIIDARPFTSVSDLERVPGIGPEKMKDIKGMVTASKPRAATAKKDSMAVQHESPVSKQDTPAVKRDAPIMRESTTAGAPTGRASIPAPTTSSAHAGRINLNTASREELEALPEIGPVKAQAIIDARPFATVDDVMRVKGIKSGTYEAIREKITVR